MVRAGVRSKEVFLSRVSLGGRPAVRWPDYSSANRPSNKLLLYRFRLWLILIDVMFRRAPVLFFAFVANTSHDLGSHFFFLPPYSLFAVRAVFCVFFFY